MENALTPKRIQKLMYLAEDKSFNSLMFGAPALPKTPAHLQLAPTRAPVLYTPDRNDTNCESSSGIIDLDRCEAFSEADNMSTAFNPGEMTGRSTGTEDGTPISAKKYQSMYPSDIDNIMKKMDQQTDEIHAVMKQSIASSYSFHSKRDLTADEASFMMREAPLPVDPKQIVNIKESVVEQDPIEMSVGSYFQHRCSSFSTLLPRADSPRRDASLATSVRESMLPPPPPAPAAPPRAVPAPTVDRTIDRTLDQTLDSVPVRQPRAAVRKARLDPLKQAFGLPSLHSLDEGEEADSISLSRIANLLGKEDEVNVSDMMQHMRLRSSKIPLKAVDTNQRPVTSYDPPPVTSYDAQSVTSLKDYKRADAASSAGTVNTVTSQQSAKENVPEVPVLTVTRASVGDAANERTPSAKSTKSDSTMSTVQENVSHTSLKSVGSPGCVDAEANSSNRGSPSAQYRELDKSVDWQELLRSRVRPSLSREKWTELSVKPVTGFVGVSTPATISITSLSESWLTARLAVAAHAHVAVDLPRFPLLLTPGKTEHLALQLTCSTALDAALPFTLFVKDSAIDTEIQTPAALQLNFTMPAVQAVSKEGVNKVEFPPTIEGKATSKVLILITDCAADLQMDLSISEGGSAFAITAVQEVQKSEVNKQLLEVSPVEDGKVKKVKGNKQLCRLTSRSALKVTLTFYAPMLSELNTPEAGVSGALSVRLLGVRETLLRVSLAAAVGAPALTVRRGVGVLGREPQTVTVCNSGTVRGAWRLRVAGAGGGGEGEAFTAGAARLQLEPGAAAEVTLAYRGPEDRLTRGTLIFEETSTGHTTELALSGGREQPAAFPVKTSHAALSWARAGRRELSLKNTSERRVGLRCRVVGEGFHIDLPGCSETTSVQLQLSPLESRRLPLVYRPPPGAPASRAALHLALHADTDASRKVPLHGGAGEPPLRWSGLVTYGHTALVRALARRPVELRVVNRAPRPAFVAAAVHFNLQYRSLAATSRLSWSRRVVPARGAACLTLHVDWPRAERRARDANDCGAALAAVTLLTGAELTRRRILRILRAGGGGAAALPEHLRALADAYEGEDAATDALIADFDEPKSALDELTGGLQELTAQVDLAPDFADETTILIADDTVLEHHTLAE